MRLPEFSQRFLRSPAARGVSSLSLMKYVTKALSLLRLAIIARLLGPQDLGVFGLALLVVAISEVFTETGINLFLLKHPKKLDEYIDTAFVVSALRGGAIATLILLFTPWLSQFFGVPQLIWYLPIAAMIPLVRGGLNPSIILFQQRLEFEKETLFRTFLQILDLASGLILTLLLRDAIGLLGGILIAAVAELILSYVIFRPWPEPWKANFSLVKKLYGETKYIIGNGIVHYLTEHSDDILIGKLLGPVGLGFYQTAYRLASAVTLDLASTIGQVLYPILARLHAEDKAVWPLVRKSSLLLLTIFVAVAIPLLFATEPLVVIAFGQDWLPIVPVVRLVFLAGAIKSFVTIWNPLSLLADTIYQHMIINLAIMAVMLSGIYLFAPRYGVTGAAWSVLIAIIVVQPYVWWVTKHAVRKVDHV